MIKIIFLQESFGHGTSLKTHLEMGGPGLTVYRNAVFTYLKEKP